MKLLNCLIVNFGCLSNRSFTFDEGLNLLYARNGQGKSTFAVFLKAMLYGLPGINKRAVIESERKRYMPWQGGSFGGSLCFEAEGIEYRLERFFGEKERDDRFALYHLATGNPSDRYSENIGVELFGVDADGFERSLYISQRLPFLAPDNNSIRARLGALLDASEDLGKFEKADKLLDEARRHYRVQGDHGLIADLCNTIKEKDEEVLAAQNAQALSVALREERRTIEEQKKQVASALAVVKAKRAEAEVRRLWEEQNASYRALCEAREAEKQQLSPLEDFFAPHFPTEEELIHADRMLTECATLSAQIDAAQLTENDLSTLRTLRTHYGETTPGGAFMEKMRSALSSFRRAKDVLYSLRSRASAERDPLFSRFADRFPTDAEQAGIRAAKEALENAEASLRNGETQKHGHKLLRVLPVVCGGAFAALAAVGFALSVFPLAIVALILSLFAFGTFFFLRTAGSKTDARQFENYRILQERLSFLLTPFGYTDRNALLAATRFFDDLQRYESLRKDEEQLSRMLSEAEEEEHKKREALVSLLGIGDTDDPEETAMRIEADIPVFTLLLQKESDLAEQKTRLIAEKDVCSASLSAFLAYFPELATLSPRDALDKIKQNMLLCKQTLVRYNNARNRIAEYLAATRFDPLASPPPYPGDVRLLLEEENALQNSFTELEALSSVKESEAERQSEIASHIAAKIAERDALIAERDAAEHTLSLLLLTKSTLEEAKDDLATRYLRDMELHFDRYYGKLTGEVTDELPEDGTRVSNFTMDTSLAISTETYGERRPVSVLSRGERDLIAFCARLSLMESIFTTEPPFLLLDDPFINLDDENYKKATALLSFLAERFQIVYTVCSQARLPANVPLKTL